MFKLLMNQHEIDPNFKYWEHPRNMLLKEKIMVEFENKLSYASQFLSFSPKQPALMAYSKRLVERGVPIYAVFKAVEKMINNATRFPSYGEILSLIAAETRQEHQELERHKKEMEAYRDEIRKLKEAFLTYGDQETLTKLVRWWLKEIYNFTKSDLILMDVELTAFECCVLTDWRDAGFKTDLERIKRIALEKKGTSKR